MPGRVHVVVALFAAAGALAASAEAYAQSCGQPPDPRYDTSGYASWCSCMGGTYNYQTTACVGATGPRRRGGTPSSGSWGCYARASNGAWGNSWSWGTQAQARSRALSECRAQSRGRRCTVRYCRQGTSASRRPGPRRTAPGRAAPRKRYAYSCSLCARKLRADLNSGWASRRIRTYVRQAIAGYSNCKRKARPPCSRGDILVRPVRACFNSGGDRAFRACVGRVLGR